MTRALSCPPLLVVSPLLLRLSIPEDVEEEDDCGASPPDDAVAASALGSFSSNMSPENPNCPQRSRYQQTIWAACELNIGDLVPVLDLFTTPAQSPHYSTCDTAKLVSDSTVRIGKEGVAPSVLSSSNASSIKSANEDNL